MSDPIITDEMARKQMEYMEQERQKAYAAGDFTRAVQLREGILNLSAAMSLRSFDVHTRTGSTPSK